MEYKTSIILCFLGVISPVFLYSYRVFFVLLLLCCLFYTFIFNFFIVYSSLMLLFFYFFVYLRKLYLLT